MEWMLIEGRLTTSPLVLDDLDANIVPLSSHRISMYSIGMQIPAM